jgi:FAD:protein FMN transferase
MLDRHVFNGPTMGTRWSVTAYVPVTVDRSMLQRALQAGADQVDAHMSNWKADSALMRLNHAPVGEWTSVPADLFDVIAAGLDIGRRSEGAFDIGMGRLVAAWGFGPDGSLTDRRPDTRAVVPAHQMLELDEAGERIRKHGEVALDLSGIAKGYGVDVLAGMAHAAGIAHFLAAIDGELSARGGKPDGSPWSIALEKPVEGRREAGAVIELIDGAIATSGDYRHFHDVEGQRVSHTMDPRTGLPVENGVASVTVKARCCMDADAWATALMVAGREAGESLAARAGIESLVLLRQ